MTNGLEYRSEATLGQIGEIHAGDHTFELCIVKYNGGEAKRADSYGSVWEPGVFEDSLRQKMPSAAWAHDWSRIIGSLKEHEERADGLHGLVQFANMDEVPDARMAWSLIRDKHIRDTSFGFKRLPGGWTDTRSAQTRIEGEKERLRRARLDEVSPVLVGAVTGAGVLSVRSEAGDMIAVSDAAELFAKLAAGSITLRDALDALERRDATSSAGAELELDWPADEFELTRGDLEDAFSIMYADRLIGRTAWQDVRVQNHSASLERLIRYWAHGEGAPKIGWGTSGDFDRCRVQLGKYVPPKELNGFCARLHKVATGAVPGKAPGEGGRSDGGRESETEPSLT